MTRLHVVPVVALLSVAGCASCTVEDDAERDIRLIASPAAEDSALLEVRAAQYALLETIAGRYESDLSAQLTQDVRLVDLRARRHAGADEPARPVDVGFFEMVGEGFEVPIARRRESAGDSVVRYADDHIVLEWQHVGGDLSRLSWRKTETGWKAAQIVLWSPPR